MMQQVQPKSAATRADATTVRSSSWPTQHGRNIALYQLSDAKIDGKALRRRIGHADVAFTMKQYVQTDVEADRQVANTHAELIIGGSLASIEIADETGGTSKAVHEQTPCTNPCTNHMPEALSVFGRASGLRSGAGFEPATSGL